ncbi:MAG: class I SAM-dependent methyltransferase [Nitrospirae bacterium]|nr:class I SAM-dependent methyltransferase [Nitrospirota bacterium]
MKNLKRKFKKKIIGRRMPGFLASIYEKAARMVINSYYVPIAEEVIAELSQIRNIDHETEIRILDVGTGPGYLPIEIAKRVQNIRIYGIDSISKSIKMAKTNAAKAGVGDRVNFEVGDAAKLQFMENFYDMIISTGVLHELKDPIKVLNEFYRVLKPGGKVFIHDPARVSSGIDKKKWIASFKRWEKIIYKFFTIFCEFKPPHTYSQEEAKEIIAATNFKQYQVEEYWVEGSRELKIKLRK